MREIISLTIDIECRDKKDVEELANWLGKKAPSTNYQKLAARFMSEVLNSAFESEREKEGPEEECEQDFRFGFEFDHTMNERWDGEFSSLEKQKSGVWRLGNADLKKDSIAWLRMGGRWLRVRVGHDDAEGYTLIVLPESVKLPIRPDFRMRWHR